MKRSVPETGPGWHVLEVTNRPVKERSFGMLSVMPDMLQALPEIVAGIVHNHCNGVGEVSV